MRNIYVIITIFCISNFYAQVNSPKQVVEDFFKAFHAKDTLLLRTFIHKTAIFQTVVDSPKIKELVNESVSDLMTSIASIADNVAFEEKILDYEVKIDGKLAHVWTTYEFYFQGKLSHIGANSFTLYNDNGNWQIIHLIDTRRKKSL